MAIILSGAYVSQDMAAETSQMPPSFLPVGGKRLFAHQCEFLRNLSDTIYLTLPDDMTVSPADRAEMARAGLKEILLPSSLSLGEAVMRVIAAVLESHRGPILVLHGDTLFTSIDSLPANGYSIHDTVEPYRWAKVRQSTGDQPDLGDIGRDEWHNADQVGIPVVSGLFSIADPLLFLRCLIDAGSEFVGALEIYARKCLDFRPFRTPRQSWLDFGHLNTFYESRRAFTTERAFNSLRVDHHTVVKAGRQIAKLSAEANWYENLPAGLRAHTPAYLGTLPPPMDNAFAYKVDYEYLLPLNELLVFGEHPLNVWRGVLNSCRGTLNDFAGYKPDAGQVDPNWHALLYRDKTQQRLELAADQLGFSLDQRWIFNGEPAPSAQEIFERALCLVSPVSDKYLGVMHGDFCFSNILYDFRRHRIRLIDPRGYIRDGQPTIFGDMRYDLAKLYHSVIGGYDFIVAGRSIAHRLGPAELDYIVDADPHQDGVARLFREILLADPADHKQVAAIAILLFLSMLPLHADAPRRQITFLANAYRLFFLEVL